ncbi:Hypothetical protein R9X50_00559400 [Acrodontium crateriforme]|uniref:Protein kinase domain-containing protein n=1 Tax=Acrodontium crateriforme TaxID=150365 RepID=A0AAQ3M9Z2_9PEZI|nr:Hypothetical protein R9X50_00559400 [Acrodontium crateriforme]
MNKIYEIYGTAGRLLFEEENVCDYRPGGYHPVALLDTFQHGRYQVHNKLGFGGFSTVWLAWDFRLEQWVSIKILTAERSRDTREVDSLRRLMEMNCSHVVHLLDEFVHEGPNGFHQCLVLELLGPTINMIVDDSYHDDDGLETDDILRLTKRLLAAVAYLHDVGLAHGDLSPRNIAFSAPRLSRLCKPDLFKILGEPETECLVRLDGSDLGRSVPSYLVQSVQWPGWPDGDMESNSEGDSDSDDEDGDPMFEEIRLIDLSEAFAKDIKSVQVAQPRGLQAPESVFQDSLDYKSDLWRAGIVIYYLTFGGMPFMWDGLDSLAASIITFTGHLPPEWRPSWQSLRKASTDRFVLSISEQGDVCDSTLERKSILHKDDVVLKSIISVIRGLMKLAPSERISASEALQMLR